MTSTDRAGAAPLTADWPLVRDVDSHDVAQRDAEPAPARATPLVFRAQRESLALVLAAILAVALPLIASVGTQLPGRVGLAVLFTIVVPGVPLIALLRIPDRIVQLTLMACASISATLLVANGLLVSHNWHPLTGLWILAGISLLATPMALRQRLALARQAPLRSILTRRAPIPLSISRIVAFSALVAAAELFWWSTEHTDLDATNATGLISVIRWPYVACLTLIVLVVAYSLARRTVDHLLLFCSAAVLIVVFYEFVNLTEHAPVVSVTWIHIAFIHYITLHGAVPHSFDARFSWPGFFAAGGQMVTAAGSHSAAPFTLLAPAFYNLMILPSLFVIGRVVTRNARLSWLAIFLYLCSNWWQQDYYSPQATALLIFIAMIATLLWYADSGRSPALSGNILLRAIKRIRTSPSRPDGLSRAAATGLGVILAAFGAAVVVSHQLTPVSIVIALLIFSLTGNTRYRSLWVVVALAFLGWFSYGATDYWYGHLKEVVGGAGQVSSTVNTSVSGRLAGAKGAYANSQYVRIGWSALLFIVGAVGALSIRRQRLTLLVAALAVAPFGLVLLQSYGGEVVIRCFVYAAPLLAPLAAMALRWLITPQGWRRSRAAGLVLLLLPSTLILTYTRGLNTAFERTPRDEVTASNFITDRIHRNDIVAIPLGIGFPATNDLDQFQIIDFLDPTCGKVAPECALERRPTFILLDSTQEAQGILQYGEPNGWVYAMGRTALDTGDYRKVFTSAHTEVLERIAGR